MRRRMNLWTHGRMRFMIDYKARWYGVPKLRDVNSKYNSRLCPICGEVGRRIGHLFICTKCEVETSSHLIACINILKKATSNESGIMPFPTRALVSLSPKWLVATVKGIVDVREGRHERPMAGNAYVS
jgi:transposase